MQSIENKLLRSIRAGGCGRCFTARDFLRLGSPAAVWQALSRIERSGVIRRLAKGLYDYPRRHPEIGPLSPDPEAVAKAIATRDGARFQPTGAYAANLLGLSDQVPAKVIFLTSGPSRRIKIGSREIVMKNSTPRNMSNAGSIGGTVIQALRHLGEGHIGPEQIQQLAARLSDSEKERLWKDRLSAPMWLLPVIQRICGRTE